MPHQYAVATCNGDIRRASIRLIQTRTPGNQDTHATPLRSRL